MRSTPTTPSCCPACPAPTLESTADCMHAGLLVKHSTLTDPVQVFLAADPAHPDQAKAISSFNLLFTQRAQPEWKTYRGRQTTEPWSKAC